MSETTLLWRPDAEPAEELALDLHSGRDYFQLLASKISQTKRGDRVALMTMSLEPDEPLAHNVLQELNAAAKRQVEVTLAVDAYAFLIDSETYSVGDLLVPTGLRQAVFNRRKARMDEIASHPSGNAVITNIPDAPFRNPYAGRSHIKGAVVNNWVAFGGPNLHGTERIDAVVAANDAATADWLYEIVDGIAQAKTTKVLGETDFVHPLDPATDVVIDVGVPGQSAIYDRQLALMHGARQKLFFTSQFVPNGKAADALRQAYESELEVQALFNSPSYWGAVGSLLQRAILMKQQRTMPESFLDDILPDDLPAIHAKIAATEDIGSIGTHNTSEAGVKFGTPEIMLYRRSPVFAQALRSLVLDQISTANNLQSTAN